MSFQITTAFVKQYQANCELIAQQLLTKFRDKVREVPIVGTEIYLDYVGEITPTQRMGRHEDTTYQDTPHTRRRITGVPYDAADLIDRPDMVQTLVDFQNPYLQAFRAGFGRLIDNLLLTAARGTAYTGVSGATAVALPSAQKVAVGGVGMTIEKLLAALKIFMTNDIPLEWERYLAIRPQQAIELLNTVEYGSGDYNTLRPLAEGRVDGAKFGGFNLIVSNQVYNASNVSYCVAWVKPCLALGVNSDITSEVTRMPTKKFSTQVFMEMYMGAARLQEEGVVEIACAETS